MGWVVTWGSDTVALLQPKQHRPRAGRGGTGLGVVLLLVAGVACSAPSRSPSGASGAGDAGGAEAEGQDVARARELASGEAALPPRAEALALAQSLEARAVREGAGPRSVALHLAAARLLERVWRVEGREQDAREALDVYRAASHDPGALGACEAALDAARLAGDVAGDAATTYAELYRAQRRLASASPEGDAGAPSTCHRDLEAALALVAAFRPPQRVLEAIDEGLAGEGAIGPALAGALDAGVASVAVRPPQIVSLESFSGKDAARVVIVLDRPAAYRVGDEVLA